MALTFQEEKLATCLEEAEPLLKRHWEAVAINKDLVPLEPSYRRYVDAEQMQRFCVCTARDNGELLGYAAFFVDYSIHYATTKSADCDVIWLEPDARRGRAALRLIEFSENALRRRGVFDVRIRVKIAHPALGRLLERAMNYTPIETVFVKVLGR